MFTALASILGANQSLDLSVSAPDASGLMKVIVKPKLVSGMNAALAQPLALTGTPEELDADFAATLAQYGAERTSLQKQVEITTTIIAEAKKNEVGKATKALSQKGKPAPSASSKDAGKNDEGDDDDEVLGGATTGSVQESTPSSPSTQTEPAAPAHGPAAGQNDDLLSQLI